MVYDVVIVTNLGKFPVVLPGEDIAAAVVRHEDGVHSEPGAAQPLLLIIVGGGGEGGGGAGLFLPLTVQRTDSLDVVLFQR